VIGGIIRTRIGFDGFLMSDDVGMHALSGGVGERARGVIEAGCDAALHCSGVMEEMVAVAGALGEMATEARERLDRAMATVAEVAPGAGYEELAAKRDQLLAYA
jgi:beta-N-acetylhexosaminidase